MNHDRLDAAFGAMADRTRRAIVERLAMGPATPNQLAALFPMSRPAVSQHLRVLREADLVRGTPSGRHLWYELSGESLAESESWLSGLAERWASAPTLRVIYPRTRMPSQEGMRS
jgi:DNA-binding transcriptional ArsR family regulator